MIAPSKGEAADGLWLAEAARRAAVAITFGGIVYVVAPPRDRRRLRIALKAENLECVESFLHVPDATRSRFLIPLRRRPLRHALTHLVPLRGRNRPLAVLVTRLPATRALARFAVPIGFAARHADSPALFEWLFQNGNAVSAILAPGAGKDPLRIALHAFPASAAAPSFVAKCGGEPNRVANLTGRLRTHAATAGAAGATVPRALATIGGERPVLLETAVPGTNAAVFLSSHPRRLPDVVDGLVTWLDRWQQLTVIEVELDAPLLDEWVLKPAARLEDSITDGPTYVNRLERLCRRAAGRIPLVTMHGDLTMANVLIDRRRGQPAAIGVVDWEAARSKALPLLDLFYMLADAAAAVDAYENRVAAARQCFSSTGKHAARASSARALLARTLSLGGDVTALCFHACWLHHANNELRTRRQGAPSPFLGIVDWVASSQDLPPCLAVP